MNRITAALRLLSPLVLIFTFAKPVAAQESLGATAPASIVATNWDRMLNRTLLTVRVTNLATEPLISPLWIEVAPPIVPPSARLASPGGLLPNGNSYVDVSTSLPPAGLAPGASIDVLVAIQNPGRARGLIRVQFSPLVWARLGEALEVEATAMPNEGDVPLNVQFSATIVGSPVGYSWDFDGNGSIDYQSAASADAFHTYLQPGDFTAVLEVTGQTKAVRDSVVVTVRDPNAPTPAPVLADHLVLTNDPSVLIDGEAEDAAQVEVSSPMGIFFVPVNGDQFSASVPLHLNAVSHIVFTAINAAGIRGGTAATQVTQDQQPPVFFIDFPTDGTATSDPVTDVTGRISDVLSGFNGLSVTVNGTPAEVNIGIGTNGTFFAPQVPLNTGDNPITVVASDVLGNEATKSISVQRIEIPPDDPRLTVLSGNGQMAPINSHLSEPLRVRLADGNDVPRANETIQWKVVRSNGRLSKSMSIAGTLMYQSVTDSEGVAEVIWQLGSDAGQGNNRVEVMSPLVPTPITLCASATPGPATQINIGSGHNQRVEAGGPALEPLRAWVSDGCNGVAGVSVTFRVLTGGGLVNGQSQVTLPTGPTGHVVVDFVTGAQPGNQEVQASIGPGPGQAATFVTHAVRRDPNLPTRLDGIVLDNAGQPIGGATCTFLINNQALAEVISDAEGQFHFEGIASGQARLRVNGLTANLLNGNPIPAGSFPALAYEILIVPNAANALPMPVLLPPLDPANVRAYSTTQDIELTVAGMEGLRMIVKAGSMTINGLPAPDGTLMSLNQVHHDDVPMPMPDGAAPPFAWTLQPGGAHFDPPIQIIYPNMSGLPAGAVAYFLSFNHETNRFEIVCSGTVTTDGLSVVSDPGAGLTIAGWGCNCPPYSVTGECENCPAGSPNETASLAEGEECDPCKEAARKLQEAYQQAQGTPGAAFAHQLSCLAQKTCGDSPAPCPGNEDWNQGKIREIIKDWTENMGNNPFQEQCEMPPVFDDSQIPAIVRTADVCAFMAGMGYHFPQELRPAFKKHCPLDPADHDCLINNVIVPCFDEVTELSAIPRLAAQLLVPYFARKLREEINAECGQSPADPELAFQFVDDAPSPEGLFISELDTLGTLQITSPAGFFVSPGASVQLQVQRLNPDQTMDDITPASAGTVYWAPLGGSDFFIDENGLLQVMGTSSPLVRVWPTFFVLVVNGPDFGIKQFAVVDADDDGDGVVNSYESRAGLDPHAFNGPDSDLDSDSISDVDECIYGTNPLNPDTDGDGIDDACELAQNSDPRRADVTEGRLPRGAVLTVGGQTVTLDQDGYFELGNIPAADQFGAGGPGTPPDFLGDEPVQVEARFIFSNRTFYAVSDPFRITQGQRVLIQDFTFYCTPPPRAVSISLQLDSAVLSEIGQTTQLHTTAILGDGQSLDVTPGASWTTYRTSNPAVAMIDENGLVTAKGAGMVVLTATNGGATATARLTVVPGDPLTSVTGRVLLPGGLPAEQAIVRVSGSSSSATTGPDGVFLVNGVPSSLGALTITVSLRLNDEAFVGSVTNVAPLPGGTTDAGDILLRLLDSIYMVVNNGNPSVSVFETATDSLLGTVAIPSTGLVVGDCAVTPDGTLGFVTDFAYQIHVVDLTAAPPVLADGTNPIPVATRGEDLAMSADGRFLVACDGSGPDPVVVVDVESRNQVFSQAFASSCVGVDACPDGSFLVVSATPGGARRLTLNSDGTLLDSGASLSFLGTGQNIVCAPDGRTGIVLRREPAGIVSFSLPAMTAVTTRTIAFPTTSSAVVSAAFSADLQRVFILTSSIGGSTSRLDAYPYDPATAEVGASAIWSITAPHADTYFGIDRLALHPDGARLYSTGTNEIRVFDVSAGTVLGSIIGPDIDDPTGITFSGPGAYATPEIAQELSSSPIDQTAVVPAQILLGDGTPNPFRERLTIPLTLPTSMPVTLNVFDVAGRRVRTLLDGAILEAGLHGVVWDGRNNGGDQAAGGVYFVRLVAGGLTAQRKVLLLE